MEKMEKKKICQFFGTKERIPNAMFDTKTVEEKIERKS